MSSRRGVALALLLVAAPVLGTACGPPPGASASGVGWKAMLTWSPPGIGALRPAVLRLRLVDPKGNALRPEELEAEAVMPSMSHEREAITFRPAGPGGYEATHTFSMDGRWEVRVRGRLEGSVFEGAFEVQVGSF